jgi:predicted small secreted protein
VAQNKREDKAMKKYSWIVALLAALSLVVMSCDTGGGGGKKGEDPNSNLPDLGDGVAGVWDWSISNDSKANAAQNGVTLPAPPYAETSSQNFPQTSWGGTSTISGEEDTSETPSVFRPGPAGKDGKTAATAWKFEGTVQVSSDDRAYNEGAQYPMVGWEAVPDTATLALLRDAYAYSFYIKVNSAEVKSNATATPQEYWVFKTAVCAEGFVPELGHEYKHYFGNYQPTASENYGPDAVENMTDDLAIGEWHKITVYLDPADDRFNLDQDGYIHQYNNEFTADFDPTTITKLQWQISLQDQKGITQRNGPTYDMPNGYFDYDVEFYGLELYLPE